ncbi:hypothetical protein [Paenibacillus sp. IHBB 10380]|uniref:hypothetical protein n=1 Tax=Paenibacillus sp. IHBB 10380 TaxID=1566358 RepID=UPI000AD4D281|nr:hypothetical protein [Paenibacillus sp. IHBB 10380]
MGKSKGFTTYGYDNIKWNTVGSLEKIINKHYSSYSMDEFTVLEALNITLETFILRI